MSPRPSPCRGPLTSGTRKSSVARWARTSAIPRCPTRGTSSTSSRRRTTSRCGGPTPRARDSVIATPRRGSRSPSATRGAASRRRAVARTLVSIPDRRRRSSRSTSPSPPASSCTRAFRSVTETTRPCDCSSSRSRRRRHRLLPQRLHLPLAARRSRRVAAVAVSPLRPSDPLVRERADPRMAPPARQLRGMSRADLAAVPPRRARRRPDLACGGTALRPDVHGPSRRGFRDGAPRHRADRCQALRHPDGFTVFGFIWGHRGRFIGAALNETLPFAGPYDSFIGACVGAGAIAIVGWLGEGR